MFFLASELMRVRNYTLAHGWQGAAAILAMGDVDAGLSSPRSYA
ncbi:hypothetical protein ACCC98_28460 [Rhizobium pisi]